jgi:hypothetical protein
MEYDGQLLRLSADAEKTHAIISQWESQNNKLYKYGHTASRWRGRRPNTDPEMDIDPGLL